MPAPDEVALSVDQGLRALTVNVPDWATLRVLGAVRRLYQPHQITIEEPTELARRFSSVYETIKDLGFLGPPREWSSLPRPAVWGPASSHSCGGGR